MIRIAEQVSRAIRILRGNRDESARASHLVVNKVQLVNNELLQVSQAEREKCSQSTFSERKIMKTAFKRVALVAAAALAIGGISAVSANAAQSVTVAATGIAGSNSAGYTLSQVTGTYASLAITGAADHSITITTAGVGTIYNPVLAPTSSTLSGNLWYAGTSVPGAAIFSTAAAGPAPVGPLTISAFSATAGTQTITLVGDVGGTTTLTITWGAAQTVSAAYSTAYIDAAGTTPSADATVTAFDAVNTPAANIAVTIKGNDAAPFTNGTASVGASVSGPGLVTVNTSATIVPGTGRVFSALGNTAFVHVTSDGTPGVSTITVTATDPNTGATVTLGTKTVTFVGPAASVVATANLKVVNSAGANYIGNIPAAGAPNVAHTIAITAIVKDANGNQTNFTGTSVKVVSSNTAVLASAPCVKAVTSTAIPAAGGIPAVSTAATAGAGEFNCPVSGVALAASGATATETVEVSTDSGATWTVLAAPLTFSIGGAIAKEVLSTDASTYAPLQAITLTVTATDSSGNAAYDQDVSSTTGTVTTGTLVGSLTSSILLGGTLASPSKIVGGIGTATGAYAPASEYSGIVVSGTDATTSANAISTTFDSANGAATSAANAATDAANEATDAANAATDAANAAADSADAATQAAQDAGDKADAALAAVTALSQQVTTLLAKVAALASTLAKITAAIAKLPKK